MDKATDPWLLNIKSQVQELIRDTGSSEEDASFARLEDSQWTEFIQQVAVHLRHFGDKMVCKTLQFLINELITDEQALRAVADNNRNDFMELMEFPLPISGELFDLYVKPTLTPPLQTKSTDTGT